MTKALKFTGYVTDGRLPTPVAKTVGRAIRTLDGRDVLVTVEPIMKRRSTCANTYY
jgi:hypothetical protein